MSSHHTLRTSHEMYCYFCFFFKENRYQLTAIAASPFCCGISHVTSTPSLFISSMRRCGEVGGAGHMTDTVGDRSLSHGQQTAFPSASRPVPLGSSPPQLLASPSVFVCPAMALKKRNHILIEISFREKVAYPCLYISIDLRQTHALVKGQSLKSGPHIRFDDWLSLKVDELHCVRNAWPTLFPHLQLISQSSPLYLLSLVRYSFLLPFWIITNVE